MFSGIPAAGFFFFSSWLTMIFWGIVAPNLGGRTIGYPTAMLITIGLWLVVGPLLVVVSKKRNLGFVRWDVNRFDDSC